MTWYVIQTWNHKPVEKRTSDHYYTFEECWIRGACGIAFGRLNLIDALEDFLKIF